jgi:hypothetical protein
MSRTSSVQLAPNTADLDDEQALRNLEYRCEADPADVVDQHRPRRRSMRPVPGREPNTATARKKEPEAMHSTAPRLCHDIWHAVATADPDRTSGLARLRGTGWQLTHLTGEPAIEHLARACRELATLRHALDTAHTTARDDHTAISHLGPTHMLSPTRRSP